MNSGINFVRKNKHLQKNTTFVLFFIINLTLFSPRYILCNNWFTVQSHLAYVFFIRATAHEPLSYKTNKRTLYPILSLVTCDILFSLLIERNYRAMHVSRVHWVTLTRPRIMYFLGHMVSGSRVSCITCFLNRACLSRSTHLTIYQLLI